MNTYENLKKIIELGKKSKEEILNMMDIFLMNNRINDEQYNELTNLLKPSEEIEETEIEETEITDTEITE